MCGTSADCAAWIANIAPDITSLKGELQTAINMVTTLDATAGTNEEKGKRVLPDMQQQLSLLVAKFVSIYDETNTKIILTQIRYSLSIHTML